MIKAMFSKQGQFFIITVDKGIIKYWDKFEGSLWGGPLQYLPPDPAAIIKILTSRNKIPPHFKDMLHVNEAELKEYEANKTDDNKLKEIVLRDAKRQGCNLIDIKII